MQLTSSALRNTHWLFIAVLSLLWLWPSRPARADFYGEAIPSAEVREYYYADDSGLIYRGGIALRDPLRVHARNAQLARPTYFCSTVRPCTGTAANPRAHASSTIR